MAESIIGKGVKRKADALIHPVSKRQRQIDVCDMLEALAVGSPNFVPVNKMVETKANEIENVITGIEQYASDHA